MLKESVPQYLTRDCILEISCAVVRVLIVNYGVRLLQYIIKRNLRVGSPSMRSHVLKV